MPDASPPPAAMDLATEAPPGGFTLWYRKGRRAKWEAVATIPTESAALAAMKASGRRNGDWITLPAGSQP